MKINGNAIKTGMLIEHKNDLWRVAKCQSVKPGKGGAFNQVELKSLIKNTKLNERFRSSESVEKVRLEERKFQFLYKEEEKLIFMDSSNFEQIAVNKEIFGEKEKLIQENMEVTLELYEERVVGLLLPEYIMLKVIETEGVTKGQTASSSYKPALLENNLRVMIPQFIDNNEKIIISSSTLEYSKRAE